MSRTGVPTGRGSGITRSAKGKIRCSSEPNHRSEADTIVTVEGGSSAKEMINSRSIDVVVGRRRIERHWSICVPSSSWIQM